MKTDVYRVIFMGQIVTDTDHHQVKINMAKLFKLDPTRQEHFSKLKRMFSGRKIVIKDKLFKADADKYQQAITQAGGVSHIELMPGADQRKDHRRKRGERRSVRRTSSILPDRRKNRGRRKTDQED